jgi:hypothetical protein
MKANAGISTFMKLLLCWLPSSTHVIHPLAYDLHLLPLLPCLELLLPLLRQLLLLALLLLPPLLRSTAAAVVI